MQIAIWSKGGSISLVKEANYNSGSGNPGVEGEGPLSAIMVFFFLLTEIKTGKLFTLKVEDITTIC